jgi:hypothetical protein
MLRIPCKPISVHIRSNAVWCAPVSHDVGGMTTGLTKNYMAESSAEIHIDTLFEYDGKECHIYHQIVMRLVIKEIVKTIGDNRFEAYEVLKESKLCDSLRQIGNYSFKGCVSLEKVEISSKLESIGSSAFEGCSGATKLIVPKGILKSIGNGAFTGCAKINRVEIPDNVEIWERWCS